MMCTQAFGEPDLQDVLLNITQSGAGGTVAYSSEMVTPGGEIIQEQLASSLFVGITADTILTTTPCPSNSGLIAQVRGITAKDGSYGGGSLVAWNLHGDLTPPLPKVTPLLTSTGKDYVLRAADTVGGNSYFSSTGSLLSGYISDDGLGTAPGVAGVASQS
jgi:hypothetical protein